ncbi:alpha/beta fold hydrolase [Halosquirtibacter xylanolyticus]|uniref:alpha/beta fold hydrolase n=1 Tax=Halosquirtibacter xylanolyticus TaxID=3374599 RepID=UPI00374A2A8C|nr:alpha/beta fold hydrolase [Prolixibacteraceae bacterium]
MNTNIANLHYRKMGKGDPLIILHGLYGSSDNWISIAKALESKFTIYLVDLRNHGKSQHKSTHSFEDMTNDLLAFINEQGIQKTSLLGHSMGGKVVLHFALQYPEMVDHLILADIVPRNYRDNPGRANQADQHKEILQGLLSVDLEKLKSRKEVDEFLQPIIENEALRDFLLKNLKNNLSEGKLQWRLNLQVLFDAIGGLMSSVNYQDIQNMDKIPQLDITLIRGLRSWYIADEDVTKVKELFPSLRVYNIPDAGHWLHAQQPQLVVDAILDTTNKN